MKIAVMSNFMEMIPGYSLTGIVKDQIRMLTEYGHDVHLFVNSKYHGEAFDPRVTMHKSVPFAHLHDFMTLEELEKGKQYNEHREAVKQAIINFKEELKDFDIAFTHDFVFTGWFLPYGRACAVASKDLPNLRWLHWIHSVPTAMRDYWNIRSYGPAHKVIYPNRTDLLRTAEQYRGVINDVRMIPHIKDMRTWFDWDEESCEFVKEYPGVMNADIVQVYPASVDRLEAKRVREVALIFAKLKKMGRSVCLVIANQWATTVRHKQSVDGYKKIAARNGLEPGVEFIFTSDWKFDKEKLKGKYEVGLPKRILRDLMTCMNLFIFPTREESFGLVLPEAVLSSGCLCVLNKSLQMQAEISGHTALYFDFGSFHVNHHIENEEQYFNDIAGIILGRMAENESIMTRTWFRQQNNWNYLYEHFYGPIMAESRGWI